jgi:hypothetical protein
MVNHGSDFPRRDLPIEDDGVPVLLVHVIARLNRFVAFPQLHSSFGITFQVHRLRMNIEQKEKKDLLIDFEDEYTFSEGKAFSDLSAFFEAILADSVDGQRSTFPLLQRLMRLLLLQLVSTCRLLN